MSLSEYGRAMLQLARCYQQGSVPKQDFERLTTPASWQFDRNGRANPETVLELKNYLASLEELAVES